MQTVMERNRQATSRSREVAGANGSRKSNRTTLVSTPRRAWSAAESCARRVNGVRSVTYKIEVKPTISTTEVKTKIEDVLRRCAEVDARRITASAHDGAVTLNGSVHSWFEKEEGGERPPGIRASSTTSPSLRNSFKHNWA